MKQRPTIRDIVKRAWLRQRGEQPATIAFWPQHYQQGRLYRFGSRYYRVTHYVRRQASAFYEVWGRPSAVRVYPMVRRAAHKARTYRRRPTG